MIITFLTNILLYTIRQTPLELFSLNYFDTIVSLSVRTVTIATLRLN